LLTKARADHRKAVWIAAMSGAIWMLMPLLASSSLLIVQRMTTLSATFLFLGFIGYLCSRRLLDKRPRLALTLMSVCVVFGASLAALAKENGALLPMFVLIAEGTVLQPPQRTNFRVWWRTWFSVFLAVPAIALLV